MVHVHLSPDLTVVTSVSYVDTASEWEELLKNVTFLKVMHKMMLSFVDFSLFTTNMEVFNNLKMRKLLRNLTL